MPPPRYFTVTIHGDDDAWDAMFPGVPCSPTIPDGVTSAEQSVTALTTIIRLGLANRHGLTVTVEYKVVP